MEIETDWKLIGNISIAASNINIEIHNEIDQRVFVREGHGKEF